MEAHKSSFTQVRRGDVCPWGAFVLYWKVVDPMADVSLRAVRTTCLHSTQLHDPGIASSEAGADVARLIA